MDDLDQEILLTLLETDNMRMQWKDLIEKIWSKKHIKLEKDTLEVYITKRLSKLVESGLLKKDVVSHKQVFYYIPESNKQKVIDIIGKEVPISLAESLKPIKRFIKIILQPENIRRWIKEGTAPLPDRRMLVKVAPNLQAIPSLFPEDVRKIEEHKKKVYGGLNRVFDDLAKLIVKVKMGLIDVEEYLPNVMMRFHNGKVILMVDASVRPQTYITLEDGGEVYSVEKQKYDRLVASGKSVKEILEQEKAKRF